MKNWTVVSLDRRWWLVLLVLVAIEGLVFLGFALRSWNTGEPVQVTVRVIDQYDRPVPDHVIHLSGSRFNWLFPISLFPIVRTDANGLAVFDSGDVRLTNVTIRGGETQCAGDDCFHPMNDEGGTMYHESGTNWRFYGHHWVMPDDGPFVSGNEIRLRVGHTGRPQEMIQIRKSADGLNGEPLTVSFDLTTGAILEGRAYETGDLCIEVPTWEMVQDGDQTYTRVWSPTGGVVEPGVDSTREAPPSGYKQEVRLKKKRHARASGRLVYFWSREKAIWGSATIQTYISSGRESSLTATIVANPRGERNLNTRRDLSIELPIAIPYLEPSQRFQPRAKKDKAVVKSSRGATNEGDADGPTGREQELDRLRQAAENGGADAQYELGTMYRDGFGVPKNTNVAIHWYEKAAGQEHAEALYELGIMHAEGEGILRDYTRAADLLRKAIKQGHAGAKEELDTLSESGKLDLDSFQFTVSTTGRGDAKAVYIHRGEAFIHENVDVKISAVYDLVERTWHDIPKDIRMKHSRARRRLDDSLARSRADMQQRPPESEFERQVFAHLVDPEFKVDESDDQFVFSSVFGKIAVDVLRPENERWVADLLVYEEMSIGHLHELGGQPDLPTNAVMVYLGRRGLLPTRLVHEPVPATGHAGFTVEIEYEPLVVEVREALDEFSEFLKDPRPEICRSGRVKCTLDGARLRHVDR